MSYALVDIGNTSLKAKVFKGKTEAYSCNLGTDPRSLALFFTQLKINQYVISSVVPSLNKKIQELTASKAYFLTHEHFLDLKVHVKPFTSVGIDRLVNAVAVQHRWNANAIIIDIGTVVTFCRVKKNGEYLGGVIVPGFQMIRNALFQGAEQLPLIDFPHQKPKIVGQSTKGAMASGLFYGAIKMINGIQKEIKKGEKNISTIITGGIPNALLPYIDHDIYERDLQFDGLKILHAKLNLPD